MKFFAKRWKRWSFVLVAAVLVLGGGYWSARHLVWPAVKAWRVERMNKEARDFLARGDNANALLTARKILQNSKENLEAWRIAVAAARARQTADVVFYQQNLARIEPTKANYLELIRLALRFGSLGNAGPAIEAVAKKASDDPEFHSLAAQFYRRIGKTIPAKFHLIALTQLKPSDRAAQLDLAEIEMAADPDRKDRALRARVRALADDPNLRVRALTLLLQESIAAHLSVETGELVNRLQAIPDLGVSERLLLLEGSTMLGSPTLPTALEKLQAEVADKPQDIARVMEFFSRTGQHEKAVAWFSSLSNDTKKDEVVRWAMAEALLALRNWPMLEAHLKSSVWPNLEYLRHAFLAYAYRAQGRVVDFNDAWTTALAAVGTNSGKIQGLMLRTDKWKWPNERYDLVWKLFSIQPANVPVQEALASWERVQGHTAKLNQIFARIVEVDPRNLSARNNFAYTSLLLDSNIARTGLLATQLANALPKEPFFATTYALALYKQGKPAEALAKLETLSASELSAPERVLLHAVFLAYAGDPGQATELLKGINLNRLLPEERRLGENALAEIARIERTKEDKTRLSSLNPTEAGTAAGWLALVSPETRAAATVEMKLTDPLYATGNWSELHSKLRTADWKTENYLRFALLAYASRARDDLVQSHDLWTQALAATDRNTASAENLKALATQWKWPGERLDTLNLIFARNPTDRLLLAELLAYYRETKHTRDMVRLLTLYVSRTSDTTDEATAQAYYSLISETNVARAHVVAKAAFDAMPDAASRRLVYAYSLWKQRRFAEANALLVDLKGGIYSDLVPVALLRAAIDMELGLSDEAQNNLALFHVDAALPEEAALAEKLSLQLAKQKKADGNSK